MPREYRNFNNVGKVSCLLVLLLAFLAVNPVMTSAFAEEATSNSYATGFISSVSSEDDESAELDAAHINSTMNISFSPAAGTATAPIGTPTKVQATATVSVQNSGGYTIYFGSENQNLTRVGGTEAIGPINGNALFNELANNTWGYAVEEGSTVSDSAVYTAVPGSVRGRAIYTNNSTNITNETKTYTLSFAARIGTDKPAGTYSNQVTMSVVSSPRIVVFDGITEMQSMTSAICSAADIGDTKQLKDTRDGKFYWVAKLADGKCWMTQNLDLDLSSAPGETSTGTIKTFTDTDTDLNGITSWTPTSGTYNVATNGNRLSNNTGQRSWSLGNYRITNPTAENSCGTGKADIAACATASTTNDRFTPYTTPTTANGDANAHYIVGNHYQWNAAVAGTGDSIIEGQASSSICPKGWRLPTSTSSDEFQTLITAGGIDSNVTTLTSPPYYFVRGGYVRQDIADSLFVLAGNFGDYWSSTPSPNGHTYFLIFSGASYIAPSNAGLYRMDAFSVRCIAR